MFGIDLAFSNPSQMNDGKSVGLVLMSKQHIILITTIRKSLDRAPKKQVTGRQFTLKLGVQTARNFFLRIIPPTR